MIKIICLGKIKEEYLKNGINDYLTRISKYHKVEIVELKDLDNLEDEEKELIKYVDNRNFNIAMDIKGIETSSIELANLIDKKLMEFGNISIFIGSSNGFTESFKSKMNLKVSFGPITMPHGVFRMILLEQIYRSFKILNNERYHK